MRLPVYRLDGTAGEERELPESLFGRPLSVPLLHEVVTALRATGRRGCAHTKTRAEVSGGGRKPWRQKGTGRARHGSIRSPLWRKGGVVFGPRPRSFRQDLPRKKFQMAFAQALSEKFRCGELQLTQDWVLEPPKTRKAQEAVDRLKIPRQAVVVTAQISENLRRSLRNLPGIRLARSSDVNARDVLGARRVVLTLSGLEGLLKRVPNGNV
ncbi:MAG: 50S ribosomal protein L4 [Elusimicrobia bacterium]|nr:50S ribosomal protein L4 [Elusimicrobiota bacterium]